MLITLEAGEAADKEAVAEKAQIKRTARGDLTAEEAIAQAAAEGLTLVPASTDRDRPHLECLIRILEYGTSTGWSGSHSKPPSDSWAKPPSDLWAAR